MSQENTTASESNATSFRDTLNLPTTDFPIRANPKVEDKEMIERWQRENLFFKSFMHNEGKEKYILHDGPPYANGFIHLGTAYNKILKDIIGKSHRMTGLQVPITPGWDCHGLPIEKKVTTEFPDLKPEDLKKECRAYANKWIEAQKQQFKGLGVLMNWDNPYLTMNYGYEASIVRAFGTLVEKGYIEKKKKTVAWCFHDQTVLAAAEIEYKERKDPSIYVAFKLAQDAVDTLIPALKNKAVNILVWTTTPWTLPLNRAVMLKPDTNYDILQNNGNYYCVASVLSDKICALLNITKEIVATISSQALTDYTVHHPFIDDLQVPIVLDHSVSTDDGTAAVHCAPGCGPIDYEVALKHNLEIFSPISADGKYTVGIEPAELIGMSIVDGQIWVLKKLTEKNVLVHKTSIRHSYPHCWRCGEGLIFRATTQWFCGLEHDNLKERALEAIENIQFLPPKAINYLKATVGGRLEWCLSRQRVWGAPIPALLCKHCEYVYTNVDLINTVADGIEQHGIEYWDTVSLHELGHKLDHCPRCSSPELVKEKDILDVWFDSGISHYAVLKQNPHLRFPADMYAEGIDQHRGWFQSSLLTSMVLENEACTKSFLTHGFIVDERGQKMSKSLGNVVAPEEVIEAYGVDGLRLWASSIDYAGDIVVSKVVLQNVAQVYRKIRNTCRFLLSNLYDFDYAKDALPLQELSLLEYFAFDELFELNAAILEKYTSYDFTAVFHMLNDYCSVTLSARYLDIIKDRLYTAKIDGKERRSAQTVCWLILDTITKLMAPILSLTAEQVSDFYQKDKKDSIHLQNFNHLASIWLLLTQQKNAEQWVVHPWHYQVPAKKVMEKGKEFALVTLRKQQWKFLLEIRSALLKAIELQREKGVIKHSLEAQLVLSFDLQGEQREFFEDFAKMLNDKNQSLENFLKEFLIVSQVKIEKSAEGLLPTELPGLSARVDQAAGVKCPRCWNWDVVHTADGLCSRCQRVLKK